MHLSSGKSASIRLSFIVEQPRESMLDSIVLAWINNSRRHSSLIISVFFLPFFSLPLELSNYLIETPLRKSMFSLLLKESMKDWPFFVEV